MTDRIAEESSISVRAFERINAVCEEFERDWQEGKRPRLEVFLAGFAGPERAALLRNLLALEVDCRRRAGDSPKLEDYARRQLGVLRFIDLRFKPGVQIPPAEVEEYYQKTLLPELKRRGVAEIPPLEEARPQIEPVLVEERVNVLLDQWLEEARLRLGVRRMETSKP